jgi:hypothetical protein
MTPHRTTQVGVRNVGAIDPELKTSPVAEELSEDSYTPGQQTTDDVVCFFNGEAFKTGEFVRSGTTMLQCRNGMWIEFGPADPDNP